MVLVGDSDLLADDFSLRKQDSPFGEMVSPMNANLDLAQNLVEQMAGDSNLIGVRSRATHEPSLHADQAVGGGGRGAAARRRLPDCNRAWRKPSSDLSELQQQKKDANQRYILSPEQQAEVDNFRKKEAEVSLELRQAQKDLRKEVVSLETRIEWLNILAMPLAVTLAGIIIAVVKRKKNSAK